ncbi:MULTISPECIES: flagellar hook assembly protein FlgD [Pseudomonas]|jgi:flagellar basal-body rod modification protein FlgD|uniref:Basal-body rod modification protein FlgD n=1 Tax=Pseudomonas fluorescens TaxID=294 RepID=A0A109KQ46_PSEFL|nr:MULTISPECIES: flagellar hook assembly protein FlgD [Pseudomonas]ATN11163.1 flagellar hook assembly protein FlgD [Pseudomonas sp. FDAARGOS_380]KAA6195414.1 flagellar hook assembly protein FlgD [Pseudomonas lactis]KRC98126.1 flagellar biosynthesis protein FlgD [Pseudomonas sp. Root9]KWV73340.1 Basal-body rod modification protein FlgD [Pseudomonas fluorescens]MBV2083512.1 flagellar hook assembly protein FlgD [Pseudomonas carnis]|eukprot:jgi/Antlo1/635/2603
MAIVDTSNNTAVQDLFNSKVKTATNNSSVSDASKTATGNQSLGKDAFLQLLVTQLKNQNPLSPQDNGAFVAQLAQFSSLEGINTLNDSVNNISSNFSSSQALQASSLVGRSIIIQTDKAMVDTSKSMTGSVDVTAAVGNVSVKITDKDGNVVRTVDMGAQSAGAQSFIWDGKNDKGEVAPAGTYTFNATTKNDKGDAVALTTSLPATVTSVTLSKTGGEMLLNLAGGMGSVKLSQIQTIGT